MEPLPPLISISLPPPHTPIQRQNAVQRFESAPSPLYPGDPVSLYSLRCILANDGLALRFIPPENRTYELCRVAVQSAPHAILYVPEHFISLEILLIASSSDPFVMFLLPRWIVYPLLQQYHAQNPIALATFEPFFKPPSNPFIDEEEDSDNEIDDSPDY